MRSKDQILLEAEMDKIVNPKLQALQDFQEEELWRFKNKVMEAFNEYIDEAENQDGLGYWSNFNSVVEVFEDILRHLKYTESKE